MRNVWCKHYKGDGCYHKIKELTLWLCNSCEKALRKETLEQIKLEDSLDEK